jgi:uncharacterized protein YdhG (YjbR/CyaY superfamily)
VSDYIKGIDPKWKTMVQKIRGLIKKNIPKGFKETISYGMIGYVVPKSIYPAGYHANPKEPLPMINLAAQKNYVALYHMGLYAKGKLKDWFIKEYEKTVRKKIDMGGACIRFKREDDIPYALIEELVTLVTVEEYIGYYEKMYVSKIRK